VAEEGLTKRLVDVIDLRW